MSPFQVSFCGWYEIGDRLHSFTSEYSVFLAPIIEDPVFPSEYSWPPCQTLVTHIPVNVPLGSSFGCIGLWVCLCQHRTALITLITVLVARSCLTLSNPVDCSPQGSSIHGILQVRILGWVVIYRQILHYVNHQGSSITTALLYILLLGSVMPPVSFSLGTAWTNWGLLGFYTNFGIVFSISVKNVIEILIEITLNA